MDRPRSQSPRSAKAASVNGHSAIRLRNRRALTAAAQDLFVERGYAAVSARDITNRAGLSAGAFYNHFKDKEELFREIVEQHVAEIVPRQREVRRSARSFPDMVEQHFRLYFHDICDNGTVFELFRRNAPVVRDISAGPAHMHGMAVMREDFEWAVLQGYLAPLDMDFLIAAVIGLSLELGSAMVQRPRPDPEAATLFAAQIVLGGLPWRLEADNDWRVDAAAPPVRPGRSRG